jgi:hypothetical protein
VVSPEKIKIKNSKILIIKDWLIPTTVKKIKFFLKFINFYRIFIKGFGNIVIFLTHLIKKTYYLIKLLKSKKPLKILKNEL